MNPPFFRFFWVFAFALLWGQSGWAQGTADLLERAESVSRKGENEKAFDLMLSALHQARKNRETALFLRAATDVARMGLDRKVNYDSAFALTREAARAVASSASDTSLATLYFNLARFHKNAYDDDDAIRWFTRAAAIFEKTPGASLKAANCYHGLADVYKYNVFNFQLAEDYYERALGIRENLHATDSAALFRIYYGLAATNRSQHDYEKALAYGTLAVTLSRSQNTIRQEVAQSMIANVYRDMGNREEAIHSYNEALRLNAITGEAEARASHYQNLGETMRDDSLYADALGYYKLAEQTYHSMKKKDERLFQNMLVSKATVYSLIGDDTNFQKAIEEIHKDMERTGRTRSKEAAETFLVTAEHYARERKYYSALEQCQRALVALIPRFNSLEGKDNPTITMIGTTFYAGEILAKKGEFLTRLYRATKKGRYLNEALKCLYLAEQVLLEERNTLDTEDAKWAFLDTKYAIYESIIASLYESWSHEPDEETKMQAYQYFERSKARSLSDALAAAERSRLIGADDSLLRVHSRLKTEEFTTQNRISDLINRGNQSNEISRLREHLVTLDRQSQLCAEAIEKRYPGYFNAMYGQGLNPLPDVQALAAGNDRVFLEYFWGSEWVYGLGISADSLMFARLGRSDSIGRTINQLVGHFQTGHSSTSPEAFTSFVSTAHALYEILVDPFEPLMKNASLQIIPDGAVNLVPFDILISELPAKTTVDYRSLNYLLKARAIGYAYSTAMVRTAGHRRVSNPSMLAVGFTGGMRERSDIDLGALQEIEGAEKELDALSARFHNGRFLRDREATESNFKSLSPAYDIIHLAIHGRGDRSNSFSASLFFRSLYDSVDDGIFHAYELYGLKLKAIMAVLSACESGIGRDYRGEGMISMASAFTSAGCENTLMSLWKVNDQASITLMDDFYQQLQNGMPIDQALRTAKLNYLSHADEITADPKTWAPLVAYGSLHQVFETDKRRLVLFLVLAAGGLLIGAGAYYMRRRRARYSGG